MDPALRIAGQDARSIGEAVDAWLSNLAARGKRPGTIKSYRTLLKSAANELGWYTVADITADSVMTWAGEKRQSKAWTGTTMNRNVGALQSLSRFLTKKHWLHVDPLTVLDKAEDDGGEGARAATTDEARALVRYAWERQQIDRRAVGNRALVWHLMFTMGLRASEPEKFTWRCLHLDDAVPFIVWTREMHKAFRPCDVALPMETSELLKMHRASLGVDPRPDDPVFATLPPRVTFRKDRDAAGVPAYDRRGRGFSPHSTRKWFSHVLTVAGVEARVIDTLMRHSTGTPGRYPDLLPKDQAPFLALLPKLWPGNYPETDKVSTSCAQSEKSSPGALIPQGVLADTHGVTFAKVPSCALPPRSAVPASVTNFCAAAGQAASGDSDPNCYPKVPRSEQDPRLETLDSTDRLALLNKALDLANRSSEIAAEALRQLRGPAALLLLAACTAQEPHSNTNGVSGRITLSREESASRAVGMHHQYAEIRRER